MEPGAAWPTCAGGVELRLRVTPRGGRNGIEGIADRGGEPVLKLDAPEAVAGANLDAVAGVFARSRETA